MFNNYDYIVKCCGKSLNDLQCTKPQRVTSFTGLKTPPTPLLRDVVEISQKKNPLPMYRKMRVLYTHKDGGGLCFSPEFLPSNYVIGNKSGIYQYAPSYILDKLWASAKGDGTLGVKETVLRSLSDKETCGRVMLEACCLDGKTAPGAFYYKLGFRFNNPSMNKECEQWIKSGGKYENAPFCVGQMHLPKENIEHCLKYGNESYYFDYILPRYETEIKRAML